MKTCRAFAALAFSFLISCLMLCGLAFGQAPQYRVLNTYTLGGEGGWDYLTLDESTHRLFITRGTHVMVVDAQTGKQTGDIPDTPGVHGVALVPKGHGYASNGRDNTVTVFDPQTLKEVARVKVGERPDAILYDPGSKRVFTFNAASHDTTAVDVSNNKVAGTVALGGKPEFPVADGGHVYVNIEDKAEMAVFDPVKLTVLNHWPITGCEEPSGLAMDHKNKRLFIVCGNKKMAIMDAENGKMVATLPIGAGADGARFDADRGLAFASNGDGTLTIVHQESPDKYSVAQNVTTARGARTLELDPKSHRIYTVTADFAAGSGERRPPMVPGTFKLVEVGSE